MTKYHLEMNMWCDHNKKNICDKCMELIHKIIDKKKVKE